MFAEFSCGKTAHWGRFAVLSKKFPPKETFSHAPAYYQ